MKRESLITTEEKLLFDILQELKELNKKPQEAMCAVAKDTKLICKVCNKEHTTKGSLMACYKKHKKEVK